jgi:hypothetical protein
VLVLIDGLDPLTSAEDVNLDGRWRPRGEATRHRHSRTLLEPRDEPFDGVIQALVSESNERHRRGAVQQEAAVA